jgi:hypothetical protein
MKQKITILTTTVILIAMTANATVWRVNNRPNVDADFTTLQAAYNGASAGDTIYVEGSPFNYGGISNFSKQLTVIGTGYWLNENDSTQHYNESSKVGALGFYNGSQGSVIEGLEIIFYASNATAISINTDNITIRRNRINPWSGTNYNYYAWGIIIGAAYNSITIEQNWIEPAAGYTNHGRGIMFNTYCVNSIVRNNIIKCDTNEIAINIAEENEATSLIISNNVIMGKMTTYYSSHYNNIIMWGTYTAGTGDISSNNLCDETQYPAVNGNQQNVDMTTVFEDYTTYIDNGYLLKTGSPAIGAGVLGVDCGAFGTNDPYVLSGMPPIPAIFDVEMDQSIGTTTLPVTIKAKSHR